MRKYLLKRILFSIFSLVCIVFVMILLLFTFTKRDVIFNGDQNISKLRENDLEYYKDSQYEKYDYIDLITFSDFVVSEYGDDLTDRELSDALFIPNDQEDDENNPYIAMFSSYCESKGYTVKRLVADYDRRGDIKNGCQPYLYAYKDSNPFIRIGKFFKNMFSFETVNDVDKMVEENGAVPGKGYYLVSDINEWENFNQYWGANSFKLSSNEEIVSPRKDTEMAYFINMSITEDNLDSDGYFFWNIAYIDKDKNVSLVFENNQVITTGAGEYRFICYCDYDENKNPHYESDADVLSTHVNNFTVFSRGDEFPIKEKGIKLIWDEYSHMPAIVGSGTRHKYLLYFDDQFPFIHQNFIHFSLGTSLSGPTKGQNVTDVIFSNEGQGALVTKEQQYPTQLGTDEYSESAYNFHTASFNSSLLINEQEYALFGDRYMNCISYYNKMPKVGYSFIMGIAATIIAYFVGIPLGILMARKKDRLADKLGIGYIIFMIAVPSLAYIYIFRSLGRLLNLPTSFAEGTGWLYYVLPVISLVLPSLAGEMRWVRRYMIDQSNSDYVKFAKSQGLSDGEIFTKHIAKNAMIPIVHGIPGAIIGCLGGAFITESVYGVPGTGGLLTTAIQEHNNGTILGLTFFYSILSITSLILGDIMLTIVDPRISFTGGRK